MGLSRHVACGGGTASWCIAELHRLPVNALRLVGFNRVVP